MEKSIPPDAYDEKSIKHAYPAPTLNKLGYVVEVADAPIVMICLVLVLPVRAPDPFDPQPICTPIPGELNELDDP